MDTIWITENCGYIKGEYNTGIYKQDNGIVLFNCATQIEQKVIEDKCNSQVSAIYATSAQRSLATSLAVFNAPLYAPESAVDAFCCPENYALNAALAFHQYTNYHFSEKPLFDYKNVYKAIPSQDIQMVKTPCFDKDDITYVVQDGNKKIGFCGNLIRGDGKLDNLYMLQHGQHENNAYHCLLGLAPQVIGGLVRLMQENIDALIPAVGNPIKNPKPVLDNLCKLLSRAYMQTGAMTSLNYYFPYMYASNYAQKPYMSVQTKEKPDWLVSFNDPQNLIISKSKKAFALDMTATSDTLERLSNMQSQGIFNTISGMYITHYHDDHVLFLHNALEIYPCPVYADAIFADVLINPSAWLLPCLNDTAVPNVVPMQQGDVITFEEFTLEHYYFPGQTLYHGGLLVTNNDTNERIFIGGDSLGSTGIDFYCMHNRMFCSDEDEQRGFIRCLNIIHDLAPIDVVCQHVSQMAVYTKEFCDYLISEYTQWIDVAKQLSPNENADMAMDAYALRTYPYQQTATHLQNVSLQVRFTNHDYTDTEFQAAVKTPWHPTSEYKKVTAKRRSSGTILDGYGNADVKLQFEISIPANIEPGVYPISFDVKIDGVQKTDATYALIHIDN